MATAVPRREGGLHERLHRQTAHTVAVYGVHELVIAQQRDWPNHAVHGSTPNSAVPCAEIGKTMLIILYATAVQLVVLQQLTTQREQRQKVSMRQWTARYQVVNDDAAKCAPQRKRMQQNTWHRKVKQCDEAE